ncbi:YfcE family phosphodiesterase [Treponema zioleckii]|uniref:YfcE family phosphodiesterase n=1 Tax=Treponema zioleckii TaxID=331680 RepID=UPI00168A8920|nr:YfcE family phosphodiesterase [Treponema zioleckii]
MIELIQQKNFAIGASDFSEALANKDRVRLLVISDSHGSRDILMSILRKFGQNVDAMCFCGDGMPDLLGMLMLGYNNPDFSQFIPPIVFFVRGNGDNSTYSLLADTHMTVYVPIDLEFTAAGKQIFMTHGHRYDVYYGTKDLCAAAHEKNASIVFFGHTHISNLQYKNQLTILNPGSCSHPRGGAAHTISIVEIEKNSVERNPKADFFEIKWDADGEVEFVPYSPSTEEINLFW